MKATIESLPPDWLIESTKLKDKVLMRFVAMPEPLRNKLPLTDAWPASEVVEHLIIVEEQVAGPWRNALGSSPAALGIKSGILSTMVSAVFVFTNVRVPTVPELVPAGGLTLPELTRRWEKARKELIAAIPENSKAAWIQHPVFGPLSSDQMGKLLVAHLKYHLRALLVE